MKNFIEWVLGFTQLRRSCKPSLWNTISRKWKVVSCLAFSCISAQVHAQEVSLCPCEKVWVTLAPDTTVIHSNLPQNRINTSYISWNQLVALGDSMAYPADDTSDDYPSNYHTNAFGCWNSVVYNKSTRSRFTGELAFTYDEAEKDLKEIVLQRTQVVNGLKDGYEMYFSRDEARRCYYPNLLVFFKRGLIYKKRYAFEYVNGRLLKSWMESYNEEGRFYGKTTTFDNSLIILPGGKKFYNKERIIYDAFVIKHPSPDCAGAGQYSGNGISTTYSCDDEKVAFEGRRVQYDPETGHTRWEDNWEDGRLRYRKDYYNNPTECPNKFGLLTEHSQYTYLADGTFRVDFLAYFPDCRSSLKEKHTTFNHYPLIGDYESYSAPGKLKERGKFNDEGEKEGAWEFYNLEGVLERRTEYKKDVEDGLEERFNEKGALFRKLRYEQGKVVEILK